MYCEVVRFIIKCREVLRGFVRLCEVVTRV